MKHLRKMILLLIILIAPVILGAYYFYAGKALPKGKEVDRLMVYKSKRQMQAYNGEELLKTYTISLGKNPVGHKQFEGDNKTPEGIYTINDRNPNSAYYKNLGVSYPNDEDKAAAEKLGKSPGGHIKIHGLRNDRGFIGKFHRWQDWTAGCIAVTNTEMDELFIAVKPNAAIVIFP
jgi:murein L,D-transpeptidase YafK